MLLFAILTIIAIILAVIVIAAVSAIGASGIILFGDVIVCIAIILVIIRCLNRRKK